MHEFFLRYRNYRHLKLSLLGLAIAIALYIGAQPVGQRSGGSWVGLGLGAVATVLIGWLMWFGVRKRNYDATGAPLRAWLSAHVYWGTALLLLVPLHGGFQLGWNVHSFAYLLMSGVIISGIVGVILYGTVPPEINRNRPGERLDTLLEQVAELDAECEQLARGLPDVFARAVAVSINETRIGGGLLRQLSGVDPRCGTTRAFEAVRGRLKEADDEAVESVIKLVGLLARKRDLLRRIRHYVRSKALLDLWLILHVPLAFATVAAVSVHIFVALYHR